MAPRLRHSPPPKHPLHPTFNRREPLPFDQGEDHCDDTNDWVDALDCILDGRAAPVAAFKVEIDIMAVEHVWFRNVFRDLCQSGGLLDLNIWNTNYTDCWVLPSPVYASVGLTGLRALRSLVLGDVVATDANLRRMISRCPAMEQLVIESVRKARNIVIRAPSLEKLEIYSYRPLCISVKKAPRLDKVKLSLSYGCAEFSWSVHDNEGTDGEHSLDEWTEMFNFEEMEQREHKQTDEIRNMTTFLGGLGCAKKLQLNLSHEYSKVLTLAKVSIPKRLPKKCYLFGLQTLTLTLDHIHGACHLSFMLAQQLSKPEGSNNHCAEFWEEQINADCVQNHLASVTFYMSDSLFEGHPCLGLCQFLVMNARVLKKISINYHRSEAKPEHAAIVEAVRSELHLWPRASPDVLLELSPVDRIPCF